MVTTEIKNFVNGEYIKSTSGATLKNFEPATGHLYSELPDSHDHDVDRAVQAAEAAFPAWSALSADERAGFLYKIADEIERRKKDLAEAESRDQGKPVHLALEVDIPRAAYNFRFFAGAILHHQEESSHFKSGGHEAFNYTYRKPLGVAGLISPWNLPLYLLTWKIAPAIAVGNTAVCKPSELTPMTAFLMGEIFETVNLPNGVVNMVFGRGVTAGRALVSHPRVPLISFTGGTQTAKSIITDSAPHFKKLSLELGGKNPNIIFADADMDKAIQTTLRSSFLNQGEICLCGSRIFVEESRSQEFLDRFVAETKKLKVGDPADPDVFMGALVSQGHFEKVMDYIKLAKVEGGKVLCGGERPNLDDKFANGNFLLPTVIEGLPNDCRVMQEEIFGPVVTVNTFKEEKEVLEYANGTKYGLSATVWTSDLKRAHRVAHKLQVGTVWINTWMMRDLRVPFGGVKASGVGREGGKYSIDFYTEPTNVCVQL